MSVRYTKWGKNKSLLKRSTHVGIIRRRMWHTCNLKRQRAPLHKRPFWHAPDTCNRFKTIICDCSIHPTDNYNSYNMYTYTLILPTTFLFGSDFHTLYDFIRYAMLLYLNSIHGWIVLALFWLPDPFVVATSKYYIRPVAENRTNDIKTKKILHDYLLCW